MGRTLSRRTFLAASGAAAAVASVPFGGFGAPAAFGQSMTNLQSFVNLRFGMFLHFNMSTFTGEEWATPNQNPTRFAPTAVNCAQWADAAVRAKMQYGILTAKHHDGFALWPTAQSSYNVMNSSFKQDIVRQYVDAFRARGLRVGLYFSIWDRTNGVERHNPRFPVASNAVVSTSEFNLVMGQIRELLTNYGTIDVFITDGYGWEMGQSAVQYQQVRNLVRSLQPTCVMIDHGGITEPFIGDAIYFEEPLGVTAPANNRYAAAQGQTISNSWFWRTSTPTEGLKSTTDIVDHLTSLEPQWTSFILNCPPNPDGVLDANIVNRLTSVGNTWAGPNNSRPALPTQQVRAEWPITPVAAYADKYANGGLPMNAIDYITNSDFESRWSTSNALPASITLDLGGVYSNVMTLEYLPKQLGRANNGTDGDITGFTVYTSTDGFNWTQVASGSWAADKRTKVIEWSNRNAGYVRLKVTAAAGGHVEAAGLIVGGRTIKPVLVSRSFPVAGTSYRIQARHSGKVVDVTNCGSMNADGTNIQQWPWLNNDCQRFRFESTGDGYYKIRNVRTGKLIDAGLSLANGGNVVLWSDANVPQQQWAVTPLDGTYFAITDRESGLALNVDFASTADGGNISQWEFNFAPQEQWQLLPS